MTGKRYNIIISWLIFFQVPRRCDCAVAFIQSAADTLEVSAALSFSPSSRRGLGGGWSGLGERLLNVPILTFRIEAGTVLVDIGEVAVAQDDGLGVVLAQRAQQGMQGGLLLGGAGVLGTAVLVQSALVADANRVLVVVAGMGTGEVLVARLVQLAVTLDVVVVAGEAEAGVVAGDERRHGEVLRFARCTAVNNYQIYLSHCTRFDYLQLAMPRVVPRAVRMVTRIWRMVFQVSFFIDV